MAVEFNDAALCPAAAFKLNCGDLRGNKDPRRVVVGDQCEKRRSFRKVGSEAIPGVAVAIVDDGAGLQHLLDAAGILPDDTHNHVDEFAATKDLLHDRTHAHVAG